MIRISIKLSSIAALLFLLFGSSIASDDRPHYVLRVVDGSMSLFPAVGPINLSNHIRVLADGRFYISLHRQEMMDGTATLKSFQGRLDAREMEALHQLLNEETIKDAAHFEARKPPLGAQDFEVFEAQIDRGSEAQRVGYFKRRGQTSDNTDISERQWRDSETALQPLVEWVRALKSGKYPLKQPLSKSPCFPAN